MVRLIIVIAAMAIAGCATRPINPPLKQFEPGAGYRWADRPELPRNDPQTLLILAFSGGGTRAAAFSYGVLEEMRRTPVGPPASKHTMLTEVDLISGVSGGSFTALAYALKGDALFPDYEQEFLNRNVESELLKRLFDPLTWPSTLSAGFGRSELAEQYYDDILFHGATFADLVSRPTATALVSATDIATGLRWTFSQTNFDVICSDLGKMRLARAAAASSAVPVVLSPVTIDNYGGTCGYADPAWVVNSVKPRSRAWEGNRALQQFRRPYRSSRAGISAQLADVVFAPTGSHRSSARGGRESAARVPVLPEAHRCRVQSELGTASRPRVVLDQCG